MSFFWAPLMFVFTLVLLSLGFPVAFTLAGSSLIFGGVAYIFGAFDPSFLSALPERVFGIMTNESLIAVPLFVFMGLVLESSKISEELLIGISRVFGRLKGGLGVAVFIVGALLAASTGIVGATVVSMGLISLPLLIKKKYPPSLATGMICASGTLGQIIPPSIVLIILADVMSSANQQAQIALGQFNIQSVSVGDLFIGALIPGFILVGLYILYVVFMTQFVYKVDTLSMDDIQQLTSSEKTSSDFVSSLIQVFKFLVPPLFLIAGVLGSILLGIATPTEAASVGAIGAILLAWVKRVFSFKQLKICCESTMEITSMVFVILIGASIFSIVFRGLQGDEVIQSFLMGLSGHVLWSFLIIMVFIFFLGFFLDFFEITFVVVPIVGPSLIQMGLDPVWLGVMIAINLQTSFLTPPFGFSLFYLRGVTPSSIPTSAIYKGVIPFIGIQIFMMILIWFFPELVTWLPQKLLGS